MARQKTIDNKKATHGAATLPKALTGIAGLDEITEGGFPRGRPTLICGAAGSGKTMLAAEFLVHGAVDYGEPGVFMMFEENAEELAQNLRSLGVDLDKLQKQKKIAVDHVHIERNEIQETGEYDLEGLFIRLGHAIDTHRRQARGARHPRGAVLRPAQPRGAARRAAPAVPLAEGSRRDRGDHRRARRPVAHALRPGGVRGRLRDPARPPHRRPGVHAPAARREVPRHRARHQRVSVPDRRQRHLGAAHHVDAARTRRPPPSACPPASPAWTTCWAAPGLYRGSSTLVSGAPGTGKSSVGASFVNAACARGERALLFAYEESSSQLLRNMRSIGIDLGPGSATACCTSTRRARRCTASSSTWCTCTSWCATSSPRWWWSTRSATSRWTGTTARSSPR